MKPLRLLLDGFGSYREPADVDFSGVDFFALVGPTGSGKSTVIDGLCFALYGTVPRWGRENLINQALAPAANACRVVLVFEAASKRYAAVRALTRNARGQVNTKEARLELLDPGVPSDAPLTDLLEASVEPLAEGPDQVKSSVTEILGLTYEHFTQSVLLPQGRFSEFLHAKASERQNLLVELLAFGVYETIGVKARERAKLAADRAQRAKDALAGLVGATEAAQTQAAERVADLADLAGEVDERLGELRGLASAATEADSAAAAVRAEAGLLAAVRMPAEVPGLAARISSADAAVARCEVDRDRADQAGIEAVEAREALPDKAQLERLRDDYGQQRELAALRAKQEKALTDRRVAQDVVEAALARAEENFEQARTAHSAAERAHAAVALAQQLALGADCPVCLRPITELPHHPVPADLVESRAAMDACAKAVSKARADRDQATKATAVAAGHLETTAKQAERIAAVLAEASSESEVDGLLKAIAVADERIARARVAAREARAAGMAAEQARAGLEVEERRARAALGSVRDSVVQLGAPAVAGTADLASAWEVLAAWAGQEAAERARRLADVDEAAGAARVKAASAERTFRQMLATHGIDIVDVARAEAEVARHRERAGHRLEAVRADRRRAAELEAEGRRHVEAEQVASMLGRLLRASSFERWLCGEALDSLVAEASETLMELSGGQYQLDRDERNELWVIDYQDAGARRPVHTLSGGETFQASLALALALSRQVIGLSAGMRDLNSMFLDEGFGTLDEDTLEVVGSTLERLSTDSDRMIGIITHVPALAERAPVRFVVSRAGTTSTLRKESVA
ncbi:MAG TPA: SMC family ATPase [Streptosporangiaceae bacterium]|nr:SMC family ATPase [Streptosporangiaceae bacterium]